MDSRSSLSSASEGNGDPEEVGPSRSVEEGKDLPYGEMSSARSRRSECREPDIAVNFVRRAESSSYSGSSSRLYVHVSYSEKSFRIAVMEVTSPWTWLEDLTTK